MSVLCVPSLEETPWPTLGPQVCDFIESYLVFGPGDLRGQPARLDPEKRALIYRAYEVFPQGHPQAGRRRFKRVAISLRKGSAKTEFAAWLAAAELHPEGPVRCDGFDARGQPVGVGVTDPYLPLVAYTEEQSEDLAYGALRVILQYSQVAGDFDIGLERIMRVGGDGKAVALANAPDARDGARTTFQHFDEPLALDTPVPTLAGWKTIGEITYADAVFGRDGRPYQVLGVSETHYGRECYRVTFEGGDSIITDGSHIWKVIDWGNRPRGEQIKSTEEMYLAGVDTPGYGKRWRLPRNNGYDGRELELPIHPYLFGLWLGDGDARNATITVGAKDVDEAQTKLEALGYAVTRCHTRDRAPLLYVTESKREYGQSVRNKLTRLHVLGNKHLPAEYLIASREQRLALLQGLMDADGFTTDDGNCTFVQGKRELTVQVQTLIRSLGASVSMTTSDDVRSHTGIMHKLHFSPNFCPFGLKRKADKCPGRERRSTTWPTIVSIEPVPSVPVRCIAVDSDDHLFLAGNGLRLTHNTHRFTLPRLKQAHRTMLANIPKRRLSDAWSLETTTAPAPGEGSVAEDTMDYARQVADGKIADSRLFFFHRQASDDIRLYDEAGNLDPVAVHQAVVEASGPVAEWSDIDGIVEQWRDPTADRSYLERVWLNRLVRGSDKAFDAERWKALADPHAVPAGEQIVLGFDGGRYHDSTALVATHIESGYQWVLGLWEQVPGIEGWEVPVAEVEEAVEAAFARWDVWRMYADPPYWESWVSRWAGLHGAECVIEWWTNRFSPMAYAIRSYANAMQSGEVTHDGSPALARHIGNACRRVLAMRDEEGKPLWVMQKERPDSPHKIDAAMAACLSWEARGDALAAGLGGHSVYDDDSRAEQSVYDGLR